VVGTGPFAGTQYERLSIWREAMAAIAALPNTYAKLGGLGWRLPAMPSYQADPPAGSEVLARDWGPHVTACIDIFGPSRCMFESNFPPDEASGNYVSVWNAFKRIAQGYSAAEKADLFSGTARRAYRIDLQVR
jgi:predicted TIM-barrel fold metal-dependent hydrolase